MRALEKHIEEVKSNSLFEGTDFKLAFCHQPLDDKVAKECGFTSLSIRIVKVVEGVFFSLLILFLAFWSLQICWGERLFFFLLPGKEK